MNPTTKESQQRISLRSRINIAIHSLSLTGKLIFFVLAFIFTVSALSFLWKLNSFFIVEVPHEGGTLVEGVIGLPHFINPVLAVTDADKDLSALIYAGLLRQNSEGDIVPELAKSYTVSEDGKVYTVVLKDDILFHNQTPITADDVIFTVQQIQNPDIKSPKRANWEGVVVEKVDDKTIRFILTQAYAPFLENLSIGILPRALWQSETPENFILNELNTSPVGAGPFKLKTIEKNSSGIPTSYELEAFDAYAFQKPYIQNIILKFYPTEKALEAAFQDGEIKNINSVSPSTAIKFEERAEVHSTPLPRVFGVFFNPEANENLASVSVRRALDISVNRDYIVNTVLQGFGTALTGPVPEPFTGYSPSTLIASSSPHEASVEEAQVLLEKAGWTLNSEGIREKKTTKGTSTLSFSISTSDSPELKEVAEILKTEWRRIGVLVDIKVFEGGNLNQNIIRPRKYDALLFGQVVNKDLDLYAFWHSSQKSDPGLNIALFEDIQVDKILEDLRTISDKKIRTEKYRQLEEALAEDIPAVFLYSPHFIYITPHDIKNINIDHLTTPSERFDHVYSWYTHTDKVWKIFAD